MPSNRARWASGLTVCGCPAASCHSMLSPTAWASSARRLSLMAVLQGGQQAVGRQGGSGGFGAQGVQDAGAGRQRLGRRGLLAQVQVDAQAAPVAQLPGGAQRLVLQDA